jgi:glutathione S-transferase
VFDGLPKVRSWRKALALRPSVIGAVVPDYADRLHAFLRKHGGLLSQMAMAA